MDCGGEDHKHRCFSQKTKNIKSINSWGKTSFTPPWARQESKTKTSSGFWRQCFESSFNIAIPGKMINQKITYKTRAISDHFALAGTWHPHLQSSPNKRSHIHVPWALPGRYKALWLEKWGPSCCWSLLGESSQGVVGPLPNGLFTAYKWGLLTTYQMGWSSK